MVLELSSMCCIHDVCSHNSGFKSSLCDSEFNKKKIILIQDHQNWIYFQWVETLNLIVHHSDIMMTVVYWLGWNVVQGWLEVQRYDLFHLTPFYLKGCLESEASRHYHDALTWEPAKQLKNNLYHTSVSWIVEGTTDLSHLIPRCTIFYR
jgi:hypothetical protein